MKFEKETELTKEQVENIAKWSTKITFVLWNIGALTFPTTIYLMGGSIFWFVLILPYLMWVVPDPADYMQIEEVDEPLEMNNKDSDNK